MEDNRIVWIKATISNLLGVFEPKYVETLLDENAEHFKNFLDKKYSKIEDINAVVLYVWRTFYDKLVEEEITVLEEVVVQSQALDGEKKEKRGKKKDTKSKGQTEAKIVSGTSTPKSGGSDQDIGKKGKKKKKKPKGFTEIIIEPEPIFVEIKKIIQSYVKTPILHCHFGPMKHSEIDEKQRYVYLIRKNPTAKFQDQNECFATMPEFIELGSMKGNLIESLKTNINQIFKPLVQTQFFEPKVPESRNLIGDIPADVTKPANFDFTRASEYRLLTVTGKSQNDDPGISSDKYRNRIEQVVQQKSDSRASSKYSDRRQKQTISERWNQLIEHKRLCAEELLDSQGKQNGCEHGIHRENLLDKLQELSNTLDWTLDHFNLSLSLPTGYNAPGQDDIQFEDAKLKIIIDPKKSNLNDLTIVQLNDVVNGWKTYIRRIMKDFKDKPDEFTPMAECALWNDEVIALSSILEQLRTAFPISVIKILETEKSPVFDDWESFIDSIQKRHKLAKENRDFLLTITEYLEKIRKYNNFELVHSLIPDLLFGLRQIWTMSSYFSLDENMQILLSQISYVFTEKAKSFVDLHTIFEHTASETFRIADSCAILLRAWKKSYLESRAHIENLGVVSRWEFDKKILFNEIDHIARISQDIVYIAKVFIEFENIFGEHLKSIITKPKIVDEIMEKVDKLLEDIVNVDYDIFRPVNLENWDDTLHSFNRKLRTVEEESKNVLDKCIELLRSPDLGLDLIRQVPEMKTRDCLVQFMTEKYESVLKVFLTEIEILEQEFKKNRANPPLTRNEPINAGAIEWVRSLCERLKKSMNAFENVGDEKLNGSYLKRKAYDRYTAFMNMTLEYERVNFDRFQAKAIYVVNNLLQRDILKLRFSNEEVLDHMRTVTDTPGASRKNKFPTKKVIATLPKFNRSKHFSVIATTFQWLRSNRDNSEEQLELTKRYLRAAKPMSFHSQIDKFRIKQAEFFVKASKQEGAMTWKELIGDSVLIEYEMEFVVNFTSEVFDIMNEVQQLEHMGFRVAPVIRMAAIRKSLLYDDFEGVLKVVQEYSRLTSHLSKAEIDFLREHIYEAEIAIQAGLGRYTWQSLNIQRFSTLCSRKLQKVASMIEQINVITVDIRKKLTKIEEMNLFDTSNVEKNHIAVVRFDESTKNHNGRSEFVVKTCKDFFKILQQIRDEKFRELLKLYDSLGPIIIKLESFILGTYTGNSKLMKKYYVFWENEIFECLLRFIRLNFEYFLNDLMANTPLFEVNAELFTPLIVLTPNTSEIYNDIVHSVNDFMERIKSFSRWTHGTCISSAIHGRIADEKESSVTFLDDIMRMKDAIILKDKAQEIAKSLVAGATSYLKIFKIYKPLWVTDKLTVCEEFVNKDQPLYKIDEKFLTYTNIIDELKSNRTFHDVHSIRINLKPLLNGICEHAIEWKNTLGEILSDKNRASMIELRDMINNLRRDVDRNIKGLEDFKSVMKTIVSIKSNNLSVELKTHEMQEIYTILTEHSIKFDYTEMIMAHHLEKRWNSLYRSALYRTDKLQPIKQKFSDVTEKDIKNLKDELSIFIKKFDTEGPGAVGEDLDKGFKLMEVYVSKFQKLDERRIDLVNAEKLFDMPLADYSQFLRAKNDFDRTQLIYRLYRQQKIARDSWSKTLWANLNTQILVEGIDGYIREFRKFPKEIKETPVGKTLELKMKQFRSSIPLMMNLKNEALRDRHWAILMEKTGQVFDMTPEHFTLENMFAMELHRYQNIAEDILAHAIKELSIEKMVKNVEETWNNNMRFTVCKHIFKDGEDRGYILGSVDEIIQTLEDNAVNLQSMGASNFVGPFLTIVQSWEKTLALIYEIIDEWLKVQRKWLYLEGVFIGGDIRSQLPEEAEKFDVVDNSYRRIMSDCINSTLVLPFCTMPGRLAELQKLSFDLEKCQKSLSEYLDTKRRIFPRFYFISTDELLSILGSNDPHSVQDHIIKMYDNIKSIEFTKDSTDLNKITGMISSEREYMQFKEEVNVQGRIEDWMNEVLLQMRKTNFYLTKKAIYDYGNCIEMVRTDWILLYQGMIALAANQVWWTCEVEETFAKIAKGDKNAMKNYLKAQNKQLDQLVIKVRADLSHNDRLKFKTIATIDVHARDVIEHFVRDNVLDENVFDWESQLRFYWLKDFDDLYVLQCSGQFQYGYEYMGLNGRLVITPLTDRIYLTITQALILNLGGAPAGPAGTGKTETVKDLAKAMGLLCVVTNCGEGMDFRAVGTILAGLAQCGAWGCFDEFNRIDISVLSVISTQLQTIRSGLVGKEANIIFDGFNISLDPKVGVFVTMNPGYAGRTELPESVKALFRPVTCIKPDIELICMISLFSDGFLTAKVLAKKMTALYKLAKEQLSKQFHYDWGLRALNSVLRMAGVEKRRNPDLPEDVVLMRVLRDMNFPKFVFDDVPLFLGLIKDLFPGIDCPRMNYPDLSKTIKLVLNENGYISIPEQEDKILQLYETMMTRHSTMLVGPTGGGKSVILNTLITAQTKMGLPSKCIVLNPKAVSVVELYGSLNPITRDWSDGLFSNIFRELNKPTDQEMRRYICFDGDIDALWIENMNSVMDDNKLLTLANGERIRLDSFCFLLFEIGNLKYASPATVSRAGMVYVDTRNLGYSPYWMRWMRSRPSYEKQFLNIFFDIYLETSIAYIFERKDDIKPLKTAIYQTALNMITQFCNVFDSILPIEKSNIENVDKDVFESVFVECLYWSLGACLIHSDRNRFDQFVRGLNSNLAFKHLKNTLYDYFYDLEKKEWILWNQIVPDYQHNRNDKFTDILVPTVDTLRTEKFLKMFTTINKPVLLVGEAGTSKTAIISKYLRNLDSDINIILNLNFSSRTSSLDVQRKLDSAIEKRTKDTYGPPIGKRIVVFIDDMNMPRIDDYGTQQPIALLKLLLERGGMFDRGKDLSWKNLKDLSFYGAMACTEGGQHNVDPRFISKFCTYNLVFPDDETLKQIYFSIFKGHLDGIFSEKLNRVAETLTDMTLNLFKTVLVELPPTPSKFHYIYNLKDLSRIFSGLLLIEPKMFKKAKELVRVWRNEFTRVICDRLVTEEDINLMRNHIVTSIKTNFPEDKTDSKARVKSTGQGRTEKKDISLIEYSLRDPLLFGDYRNAAKKEDRYYEDLLDYQAIYFLFQEILEEHNEQREPLHLVLFEDCLEHLTRINRTMRMHRGHILLIGLFGSGKRSITRLAAFAADREIFEISMSRGYNEISFREDLKKLFHQVGVVGKQTVFIFKGGQIVEEGFLEIINNILTTGFVPALFSDEEKDQILSLCRTEAIETGCSGSKDSIWTYFMNRSAENLHVVICMSPSGDNLRNYCRSFPGLVGSTSIDWIFPWPKQALFAVAEEYLSEQQLIPELYRTPITKHMVHVHTSAKFYSEEFQQKLRRWNYLTPKHYLDYIHTYINLIVEKNDFIKLHCNRLEVGIKKIDESSKQIDNLRMLVSEQQQSVLDISTKCEIMVHSIEEATNNANHMKISASEKSILVEDNTKRIAIEKAEAEQELFKAEPAVNMARSSLEKLRKEDIAEIRSFAAPDETVQIVCECVAILYGAKDISYKSAKSMMAQSGFVKNLTEIKFEEITSKQIRDCKDLMKKSSRLNEMASISKAGYEFLKFVKAAIGYVEIYRRTKPKRERVEKLEKELDAQIIMLNKLTVQIKRLEDELSRLKKEYEEAIKQQNISSEMVETAEKHLVASKKLISGLSSESERWRNDLQTLHNNKPFIVGECLLGGAFLAYTGVFTSEFRHIMIYKDWLKDLISHGIPISPRFQIEKILASDVEISNWNSEGLPSDELSVQNGILTVRSSRYPVCIDPHQQALNWILKRESKNKLKILSFSDTDFLKQLEIAIIYGSPVLFQDVDDYIDPVIENLLEKNFKTVAGGKFVKIGDKEINLDSNFRLYLTTKFSNPKFDPAIYTKALVINYTVTEFGLEDQLLSLVVGFERPDLETQRKSLILETSKNEQFLKVLEDSLLGELSTMTKDILDNTEIIETLDNTREKALEIFEKIKLSTETTKDIEKLRDGYRPAAKRGAVLFFVINDFATVNPMYQYALRSYLTVFSYSLKKSNQNEVLDVRIENIIKTLTEDFYNFVCTGIFEKDKLLFSFQMTARLEQSRGGLSQNELDFFIKGSVEILSEQSSKSHVEWISEKNWTDLCKLSKDFSDDFGELSEDVEKNSNQWRNWSLSGNPEDFLNCPGYYRLKCSEFQKLMLLRCFRIDRIHRAITKYVTNIMGEAFVMPPVINFDSIYEHSTNETPVLFILSPGSDPTIELIELAERCDIPKGKIKHISLGQGQEKAAINLLNVTIQQGEWLILQNAHLLINFVRNLDKVLEKIENPHPNFRLWITTDPVANFPIGILQKSFKVVTEPPSGLKLNLRSTFHKISKNTLESCTHPIFKPLVYVLAFFHAVVQERRNYNTLGWNIPYDFNESDFNVSVQILETYLNKSMVENEEKIPWTTIKYLIGEVMYGGRVIDDFDRRTIRVYLEEYLGEFLFDKFQPFHFYRDSEFEYSLPENMRYKKDFLDHIEKIPLENKPNVFGLHSNAEIVYYTKSAQEIWSKLIELQPQTVSTFGGMSRDKFIENFVTEILEKLPKIFEIEKIRKNFNINISPTGIVLLQELECFNNLVERMEKTLKLLKKALAGEIGMDIALESIAVALFNGKIPDDWRKLAPETCKNLGSWIEHLNKRATQYKFWSTSGEPIVIWLSGLHNPESYLTAIVQMASRKLGWALDRSTLYTTVTKYVDPDDVEQRHPTGCYIYGLYLEGAHWDIKSGKLDVAQPKALVEKLPILSVIPIEINRLKLQDTYRAPVYTTSKRRNAMGVGLVFEADLSTLEDISHWILQGVCLTLNTDD